MNLQFEIPNSFYGISKDESSNEYIFSKKKQILKTIGKDEVLIEHEYIGFNYYDFDIITNFKKNKISDPANFKNKIFIPGIEAIGTVKITGENAREFKPNERVLYISKKSGGAYSQYNIVNKNLLISSPNQIPSKDALAISSRGIMAHMLLKKVYIAEPYKTFLLITNPTGALGHIIAQVARFLNLNIIASVQDDHDDEKKKLCKRLGFFDLIVDLDKKDDFHKEIMNYTKGLGINLVIDTIGGANLNKIVGSMLLFSFKSVIFISSI
jgi:NADPH2:quinone reductase